MILVTTDTIVGKRVVKTHGFVRGNTIRARNLARDIVAGLRILVGGEVHEYTKLMAEAREQALDRMREEATALGANAILMVRFATSEVASNAAEILVYGTAVTVEDDESVKSEQNS